MIFSGAHAIGARNAMGRSPSHPPPPDSSKGSPVPRTRKIRVPIKEPEQRPEMPHLVSFQGTYLNWHVSHRSKSKMPDKKRGNVSGFSAAARLRLLKWFNTVNWSEAGPGLFITLTFPDDAAPTSPKRMNQMRHSWWRSMERYTGEQKCGAWRIEWKPRLSGKWVDDYYPHIHIFMFKTPWLPWWVINKAWKEMHNVGYIRTDVEAVYDIEHAGMYVSKYVGKCLDSLVINAYLNQDTTGRAYGFMRKKMIPVHQKLYVLLEDCTLAFMARDLALKDKPKFNSWGTESFSLLGPMARRIAMMLFTKEELDDFGLSW